MQNSVVDSVAKNTWFTEDPPVRAEVDEDDDTLENSFLTMLTEELKNQDPANPLDSSRMVTQLSQLSAARNLFSLKKLAENGVLTMLDNQRLASAGLIGKSVGFRSDHLLAGDKKSLYSGYLRTHGDEKREITLKITSQKGRRIKEISVQRGDNGQYNWAWDGCDMQAKPVAGGFYSITTSSGENSGGIDVVQNERVKRVNFNDEGYTSLRLDNDQTINMQDVVSIES